MTRTSKDNDRYGQVDVALVGTSANAVQLTESETRTTHWIPRSLLSYTSEEFLDSISPSRGALDPNDFDTVEIKLWKIKQLEWG